MALAIRRPAHARCLAHVRLVTADPLSRGQNDGLAHLFRTRTQTFRLQPHLDRLHVAECSFPMRAPRPRLRSSRRSAGLKRDATPTHEAPALSAEHSMAFASRPAAGGARIRPPCSALHWLLPPAPGPPPGGRAATTCTHRARSEVVAA
jgi:hypothetical protein